MDKQLTSEKERLAARIAELEARLSAVQTASSDLGTRAVAAITTQQYGDYIFDANAAPENHATTKDDIKKAEDDFVKGEKVTPEVFKYALSPEERRKPKGNQATGWKTAEGGERVYYTLKKYFDERINSDGTGKALPGNTDGNYSTNVNAVAPDKYVFHDWQVKVVGDTGDLTKTEVMDHINYWVNGDKEGTDIIDPATGNEMTDEEEDRGRYFDPSLIKNSKENIIQLKSMIALAEKHKAKEAENDWSSDDDSLLVSSRILLDHMLKAFNVLTKTESGKTHASLKEITTYANGAGKWIQSSLGVLENEMSNIRAFKDFAIYAKDEKIEPVNSDIPVDGKKTYIKIKGFGTQIAEAKEGVTIGDNIAISDADWKSEQEKYADFGEILHFIHFSVEGAAFKGKHIYVCYTVISEEGAPLFVCEYSNMGITKTPADLAAEAAAALLVESVKRKYVTMRGKCIENMAESVTPLQWYKPILTYIDFAERRFQNRIPSGTNLRDADFEGSNLTGVSLIDCDIRGANFKDCVIDDTNFSGCTWDETTIFPLGFGDIEPDYFTVLPDGATYGQQANYTTGGSATFETLATYNTKAWFPWSSYVGSNGSHDPSGATIAGAWAGTNDLGLQHWEDYSANIIKKNYIENSSVARLTEGMKSLIYVPEAHKNNRIYPEKVGQKLKTGGHIQALFGIPPTFVLQGAGTDKQEFKRGSENLAQDVSSSFVLDKFFTKESATLMGSASVTISPLMRFLAKGSSGKTFRKIKTKYGLVKSNKDSILMTGLLNYDPMANNDLLYMIQEEHGSFSNAPQEAVSSYKGELIFETKTINIDPLTDFSEQLLSTVGCPSHKSGYLPLAGDESFKNVPYNVIFNYDGKKPVDCTGRADKDLIGEVDYIRPYNTAKLTGGKTTASRYQKKCYEAASGELSRLAVEEFLNVAEYPSFNWCAYSGLKLDTDGNFSSIKTASEVDNMATAANTVTSVDGFITKPSQQPETPMHEFVDYVDLEVGGNKIDEKAPRFLRFPVTNMEEADFTKSKFGYYEYNYNKSTHPDSATQKLSNVGKQSKFYATYFGGINLNKAKFNEADLKKCVFHNCNLQGADFTSADIRGAIFINCTYSGETKFDSVIGNDSTANMTNTTDALDYDAANSQRGSDCVRFFNFEATEIANGGLSGPNTGVSDMSASFVNAQLQGVEIMNYRMGGCHNGANMTRGVFHNVQIMGAKRGGCTMNEPDYRYTLHYGDAFFREIDYLNDKEKATKANVDLSSVNLIFPLGRSLTSTQNGYTDKDGNEKTCSEPSFVEMARAGEKDLKNSVFVEEDMTGCSFINADLQFSDFSGCKLDNANFCQATATDCSFNGANFYNVNATDAAFNRSLFEKANITGKLVEGTLTHEIEAHSTLAGADFGGCDFQEATINYYNVTNTNFRADLNYSTGTGADDRKIVGNLDPTGEARDWKGTWIKDTKIANLVITVGGGASKRIQDLSSNNGDNTESPEWPQGFEYYVDYKNQDGQYIQKHPPRNRDINDADALRDGPTIFQMMYGLFDRDGTSGLKQNVREDFLLDIAGVTIANKQDGGGGTVLPMVFSTDDSEANNQKYRTTKKPHLFWKMGDDGKYRGLDASGAIVEDVKFDRCILPKADFTGIRGNSKNKSTNEITSGTSFVNIVSCFDPDGVNQLEKLQPTVTPASGESADTALKKECGLKFVGADLSGSGTERVFFNGAQIPYSDFKNANLQNVDFGTSEVWKQGVNYLKQPINWKTDLTGCDFSSSIFDSGTIFTGATLDNADFTGNKTLIENTSLTITSAANVNFNEADLSGCLFKPHGDISELNMDGALFEKASIKYCNFSQVRFNNVQFGSKANPLDLDYVKFLFCDLEGANFKYSKFNNTLFQGASNQSNNMNKLISEHWPVGYYNCRDNADGVMTVRNWPATSAQEGGFDSNEKINKPLAEIMLRHGVYEMERDPTKGYGAPDFTVLTSSGDSKRIMKLRLDYQAPSTFELDDDGVLKSWAAVGADGNATDPAGYAKNMALMTNAAYVYPYVENHWADKEGDLVHRPRPTKGIAPKRINCSTSDASGVVWDNCDIFGVNFKGSDFNYGEMRSCHFYECSFEDCAMNRMRITNSQFDTCSFNGAKLNTLDSCNENHCEIVDSTFIDCTFVKTEMKVAHLQNLQLSNCNFDETDFTDAYLDGCAVARVPVADSLYEDVERYGSGRAQQGRRGLYNNLETAIKESNKKRVTDSKTVISTTITQPGGLTEPTVVNIGDINNAQEILKYNKYLILKKAYDEAWDKEAKANQEEEKRFLWKPKTVRFPKIKVSGARVEYTAAEDAAAEKSGALGGAYHSNFTTAIFKNTLFNKFSIEGKTEDLHGINKDMMPPGMVEKLYNNAISTSTGTNYTLDSSGNMENMFERVAWWDGQGGEGSKLNILSGAKSWLPKQISTVFGEYDLSHNKIIDQDAVVDGVTVSMKTQFTENSVIRPGYGNVELFNDYSDLDGAVDGVSLADQPRYHRPGKQGWYAEVARPTTIGTMIYNSMSRRTNNCGFDTTLQGSAGNALNGDGIAFKDISGASRVDGPTFRERILKGVKHFPTASMARKVDLSEVSRNEKKFSLGTSDTNRLSIRGIILSESNLSGATEEDGCQFVNVDATGGNFAGANLTYANFAGAILRDCNFDGANLTNVNFEGSNLIGANLRNTVVSGVKIDSNTQFRESGVDKTTTISKARLSDYLSEGTRDATFITKTRNYEALSAKIGDFTHVFPQNALPFRYTLTQTNFDDTINSSGQNVTIDQQSSPQSGTAVQLPYGFDLGRLTTSGTYDTSVFNLGSEKISQNNFEMPTQLEALRGGIPLAGGKNYASIDVPRLKGEGGNQASFTPVDTTNNIHWKWLSRRKSVAQWNNDFNTTGDRANDMPVSYDTIDSFRSDDTKNHVDFRDNYQQLLIQNGKHAGMRGGSNALPHHFPPTKQGDLMIYDIKKSSAEKTKALTATIDGQPRYDFSTPDVLETGQIHTNFSGCDLHDAILPYSNFRNVVAVDASFNSAVLRDCDFSGANLSGSHFEPYYSSGVKKLVTDLVDADFRNADLRNCIFDEANLAYADFSGAQIQGCTFWGANLAHADFRYANFGTGANFIGAGPWYFTEPGMSKHSAFQGTDIIEQQDIDSAGAFWTLAKESETTVSGLNAIGYSKKLFHEVSLGKEDNNGRLAFKFMNEAKTQPRSVLYDDSANASVKAHTKLKDVLPKMPKGFNIMRAFGWERDLSGIIQSRYRNEMVLYDNDGTRLPSGKHDFTQLAKANNYVQPHSVSDAGQIAQAPNPVGYRNNGLDYSGNILGHRALPATHGYHIDTFLSSGTYGAAVADPNAAFEYGIGPQAIRDGDAGVLTGLKKVRFYEHALKCSYFDTLSDPITDLSGLVLHDNANKLNLTHAHLAQTKLEFKHCDLSGMDMSSAVVIANALSFLDTSANACKFDGASLKGADFTGVNTLNKSTFHLADLTDANFEGVDLTGASFTNVKSASFALANKTTVHKDAIFNNTSFVGATNANLAEWPLGFDYSGAIVDGVMSSNPTIKLMKDNGRYNFTNVAITGDLSGVDFSGANLANCVFDSTTTLTNVDLSGADLTGATFSPGIDLEKVNFTNWTTFAETKFSGAINEEKATSWPQGFNYKAAVVSGHLNSKGNVEGKNTTEWTTQNSLWFDYSANALYSRHDMSSNNPTEFEKSIGYPVSKDVTGVASPVDRNSVALPTHDNSKNFVGQDIAQGTFDEESFYNSATGVSYDFSGSKISGCSFYKADLSGVNFIDAFGSLDVNTGFIRADLTNCDFTGANLTNADLSGADLMGASFYYAKFNNTNLYHVSNSHNAYFPAGFDFKLSSVANSMTTYDPTTVANSIAQLYGSKLDHTPLAGKYTTHANNWEEVSEPVDSIGKPRKNLPNGINEDARMPVGDKDTGDIRTARAGKLRGTVYDHKLWETFPNANGTNKIVTGFNFASTQDLSGLFHDVDYPYSYLANANLVGANLSNADLTGSDLKGSDLSGADLSNCNLTNTHFGATGSNNNGINISRATLLSGTPGSTGRDQFQGVKRHEGSIFSDDNKYHEGTTVPNLRKLNAQSCDLSGFNFSNCDLLGANFTNSNLTAVDFSGADLKDAIFIGANLESASLKNARITGADFRLSKFIDISGRHAVWDANTKFPVGFELAGETTKREKFTNRLSSGLTAGLSTDVAGNFDYSKLNNARRAVSGRTADKSVILKENDFKDLYLGNEAGGVNLAHWNNGNNYYDLAATTGKNHDLSNSIFSSPNGTFDLSGAKLGNAILHASTFIGANLTAVDFSGVDISATSFKSAELKRSVWTKVDMSYNKGIRPLTCPPTDGMVYFPTTMHDISMIECDCEGVVFAESTDMSGADMSGTSFKHAVMQKVNLSHANLLNASLEGCLCDEGKFNWADLSDTDLSGAAFGDVELNYATLTDVSLNRVKNNDLRKTTMNGATIINSDLSGTLWEGSAEGATFQDLSFNKCDFALCGTLDLSGATFTNVSFHESDFKGTNFSHTTISNMNFKDCSMSDVKLAHADIRGSDFSGVDLTNADLSSAKVAGTIFTNAIIKGVKGLAGSDLSGAKLDKINFTDANGVDVDGKFKRFSFEGCNLGNNDFAGSDLSGVDFSGATITFDFHDASSNLALTLSDEIQRACNTQGNNNDGIKLDFVEFKSALPFGTKVYDLSRVATMEGLEATGLDLSNCVIGPRLVFMPAKAGAISYFKEDVMNMKSAKLPNVDFTNTILKHVNLTSATLTGADLSGADLTSADLSGADLTNAKFSKKSKLVNTNLTNADLSGVDLKEVDLSSVTLENTNFTNADLAGIKFYGNKRDLTGNKFKRANFVNLDLSNCQLMGIDFTDASMNTVDLSNSDLSGVTFTQTVAYLGQTDKNARCALIKANLHSSSVKNLDYAIMHDMSFDAIDLSGIKGPVGNGTLTGASFVGSELAGAIFSGLTLKDVDFGGCDLSGSKFIGTTFRGAINFAGADLSGVDISGADMSGTKLGDSLNYKTLNFHDAVRLHAIDFENTDLTKMDLSGLSLTNVNLTSAALDESDLTGATLTGADFTQADLSAVNFKQAILKNAKFINADLSHADLSGSDLTGADFTQADLSSAIFDNATISQTTFYQVLNAPTVSGKDAHRYYKMPNGSVPDGAAGFRDQVSNIIVDISGQNLAINSRGHTGNDGEPEATHPDVDASCYSKYSY